ncbi:hypothetical protein BRADI_4g11020v3 [Brachypodium distachyon]|uniref:Isopenicillin N synthase-like Fe(2+) 2OG dioxygenase domain-containing protein n=1 Tax=Brachypodium distachyon TaxID=15368 RepID=I1IJM3_BRADI|nr:hypothetical protein BRADI_4g11020v3 [Brachypodium distachyon]
MMRPPKLSLSAAHVRWEASLSHQEIRSQAGAAAQRSDASHSQGRREFHTWTVKEQAEKRWRAVSGCVKQSWQVIVSNTVFKTPWHHVVTNAEKERMSLVVFYQPEPERIVGLPGELVHEERPPFFKRCLVQTLADGYWDTFAVGDRTVDFLNVRINDEAVVAKN